MGQEAVMDYIIYNGKIVANNKIDLNKEIKRPNIYEVIKVIDGEPLYLEEHIDRLRQSLELVGVKLYKKDLEIIKDIYILIEKNNRPNMNIKLLCSPIEGSGNDIKNIYLYFKESIYPSESLYLEGVHTILFNSERDNPNAKTSNLELRKKIDDIKQKQQAFEVLLVNDMDQITEGSRSNLFFVKGNDIYTPPSEKVLLGVTRKKIVELCIKNNIKVIEKNIYINELDSWEGAFITGTSIKVLPIKSIERFKLKSSQNDTIIKLMKIYEEDMVNYIKNKKLLSQEE